MADATTIDTAWRIANPPMRSAVYAIGCRRCSLSMLCVKPWRREGAPTLHQLHR